MKKSFSVFAFSFLALVLLIAFPVFAEDAMLGTFQLTEKQLTQMKSLTSDVVKGFCFWEDGRLVVTSTRSLTSEETEDLITAVTGLPDEYSAEEILARFSPELAIAREAQVFSATDMVRFAPIGYNINELIRFKNFWGGVLENGTPYVGLKQFCQAAISSGTGMFTQDDYDRLNGILKEQGIDLDNQG